MSSSQVHLRFEHADEWQVPIALGVIEPVSNDKQIRNLKTHVIRPHFLDAPRRFVEQDAGADALWLEMVKLFQYPLHGPAGVEDVIDKEHIPSAHIQAQFLGEDKFAGLRPAPIAGHTHEIEAQRKRKVADEVRKKQNGPVQQ